MRYERKHCLLKATVNSPNSADETAGRLLLTLTKIEKQSRPKLNVLQNKIELGIVGDQCDQILHTNIVTYFESFPTLKSKGG